MMSRAILLALLVLPSALVAQMTVEGRVVDQSGVPIPGASVSVAALNISVRTANDGRYNFIVRQALITGQTVEMVARHSRFGSHTIQLSITGGSVSQDFVLPRAGRDVRRPADTTRASGPARVREAVVAATAGRQLAFDAAVGTDIPSVLAGQYAPLRVDESNAMGGSDFMIHRGVRSLFSNAQPLVVVDGVPLDNQGFTTTAQRFGQGGFDYGTPLQDLAPEDIATVEIMDPAAAALQYGSRAANGVLRVTTRSGREISGVQFSVTPRVAMHRVAGLPGYQNQYGQGLGGTFEFFDGRGGGINDDIGQSWGPRLDGRPLAQHSLTEAGRPDVRFWLPRPDGIRAYFPDATDLDIGAAVLGSRGTTHFRAAINARDAAALTPGATLQRLGATFNGGTQLSSSLGLTGNLQLIRASARERPGSGFDEVNPVAGFTRFGRQVDLDALRDNLVDADGNQINWIYTARNNPFFATSMNANDDDRTQLIGVGTLTYALASWLNSRLQAGVTDYSEARTLTIASGWRGGFPTSLGRGDFAGGGEDRSSFGAGERFAGVDLDARHGSWRGTQFSSAAAVAIRTNDFESQASVTDRPLVGAATITNRRVTGRDDHREVHARVTAVRDDNFALTVGTRLEQFEFADRRFTANFPSLSVSYDLGRGALRDRLPFGMARLHASAWKSGSEVGSRTLNRLYFGGVPIAPVTDITGPERTTGIQLGAQLGATSGRFGVELVGYRERSTDLLVATAPGDGSAVLAQTGQVFNGGYEVGMRAAIIRGAAMSWDVDGSFHRNVNTVDALQSAVAQTPLSPMLFGAMSAARVGSPVGVIVGSQYLKDAAGALLLRNGLPQADRSALAILGSGDADWTAALRSRFRYRDVDIAALFDARIGGDVFSATNLWGSYAGTLASTLIGDRDASGSPTTMADSIILAGVDEVSGLANETRVSAEQYFHALAEITEPWIYDASVARLRVVQLSYQLPTRMIPGLREHVLRVSLAGRNLAVWSKAPNIEPGLAISSHTFQGFEMGQLPGVRSFSLQISVAP